jgi:hypothetical protein
MLIVFLNTLRSRHGTSVDFDKICVFYGKCCVRIDKCVFIIIKIKCVNFDRISDICDKINFTTNYTHFTIPDIYFIKTHTTFYQNTHKYYNFLHLWRDGPAAEPKNFPYSDIIKCVGGNRAG